MCLDVSMLRVYNINLFYKIFNIQLYECHVTHANE